MQPPVILFGAFDRHNLGDLLFPHIVSALLPGRELIFAGLAQRDMRCYGGHQVQALVDIAGNWGDQPTNLIHVGGELLDCDLYQAALMLQPAAAATAIIANHDQNPAARQQWAQQQLGLTQRSAYLADKRWFPHPGKFIYNAIGGVDFAAAAPECRAEVLHRLQQADFLGVRDRQTQQVLAAAGIASQLQPDCVTLLAELFAERIAEHRQQGEVRQIIHACGNGYLAVQFAAECGDDASVDAIATQLALLAEQTQLAIVFFRAGAAPWHDDLDVYRRTITRLSASHTHLFQSLDIWDICALLSASRAFCGTSLHGRIIANCFGLPGVSFTGRGTGKKLAAWLETAQPPDGMRVTPINRLASALERAMAVDRRRLSRAAGQVAQQARQGGNAWLAQL